MTPACIALVIIGGLLFVMYACCVVDGLADDVMEQAIERMRKDGR
jgi:hypothetical protein